MPLLPPEGVIRRGLGHAARPAFMFGLTMTVLTPAVQALGARGVLNPTLLLLVAAPWVLGLLIYVRRMCPRCCPECANRSMIPLRNFWGVEQRIRDTLWCTCCGSFYYRRSDGEWKKERRRIWLDLPGREAKPGAKSDSRPFNTDSRLIASVVRKRSRPESTPASATVEAVTTSVSTPRGEDSGMPGV